MTSATPSGPTISNTSCLIILESIGRLDLLKQLYQDLVIPPAVAKEWGTTYPAWISIHPVQNKALVQALRLQVGPGEAEAIALALETGAVRLSLDDRQARHVAARMQVPITGTIGIVLRAKQLGIVPLVRPIFDALRAAGFRVSDALLATSLQLAGE